MRLSDAVHPYQACLQWATLLLVWVLVVLVADPTGTPRLLALAGAVVAAAIAGYYCFLTARSLADDEA